MTKIEWCDKTLNPLKMRCTKVSEGCQNCYTDRFINLNKTTKYPYPAVGEPPILYEDILEEPARWRKPRKVFVESMGDLFHEDVTLLQQRMIFSYMKYAPQHTYIILTKRPGMMHAVMNEYFFKNGNDIPGNWWLGVTIENDKYLDRWDILSQIPAAVRFVSVEPMLSGIDFGERMNDIDWVICGAETGPKARPIDTDWVGDLIGQCRAANVPFFFKKWGKHPMYLQEDCPEGLTPEDEMPREFPRGV